MPRLELSPPDITERESTYAADAISSGMLSWRGSYVERFEHLVAQLVCVDHAVAVCSGTAALHLALLGLGVRPGDLVVTTSFTFVAPINAIRYCGAAPLYVDVSPETLSICPIDIEELLEEDCQDAHGALVHRPTGRRVAALLVIHLYGSIGDVPRLLDVCRRKRIPLIEDAAESLGSSLDGTPAGSFGDVACFSFNANKVVTCGGGGAVVSRDMEVAARVRHLSRVAKREGIAYEHTEVGYNYALSNVHAAIGCAQLERLPDILRRRRSILDQYRRATPRLPFVGPRPGLSENAWMALLAVKPGRGVDACNHFLDRGIEARPAWAPLHTQEAFRSVQHGALPMTSSVADAVCVPCQQKLTSSDVKRVLDACRSNPWRSEGAEHV